MAHRELRLPAVDGIFVGAGHNALVAAAYLARCGMRVLVLDGRPDAGGGLVTSPLTLPLFLHNWAAFFLRWTPRARIWRDLDLGRHGVRVTVPPVQVAIPFAGGGGVAAYRSVARTAAALRRFSRRDAAEYARTAREFGELARRVVDPIRSSPPLAAEELAELLGASASGRRFAALAAEVPLDLVRGRFEHEVTRTLALFNVATRGFLPLLDVPGVGGAVVASLPAGHGSALVRGGSARAAEALARSVYAAGGLVVGGAEVARIRVGGGRATGVELADGRVVEARRFVCSSLPPALTLGSLVDAAHVDAELRARVLEPALQPDGVLGVHLALRQPPRYGGDGAELGRALNHCVGYASSDDFERDMHAVRAGEVPAVAAMQAAVPSLLDPAQAPPGHTAAFAWRLVPLRPRDPSLAGWQGDAPRALADATVRRWAEYAPNLAQAELARAVVTPADVGAEIPSMIAGDRHHGWYHPDNSGARRPHPALSGYRTPIEGLYHCGSSMHPGGAITGQPGYNAATVIARDLHLPLWWNPPDVRAALRSL